MITCIAPERNALFRDKIILYNDSWFLTVSFSTQDPLRGSLFRSMAAENLPHINRGIAVSGINSYWLGLSIGSKMRVFVILLLLVILSAAGFNYYTVRFSVGDVNQILKEISRCEDAQDAMHAEAEAFRLYVRVPSEDNLSGLNQAVSHCRSSILLLPYDYDEIGAERYARTWRIRNAYQSYSDRRDSIRDQLLTYGSSYSVATALEEDKDTLDLLYQVYDMQTYLNGYLSTVSQLTVKHASELYDMKYPMLQSIPYLQVIVSIILILVTVSFAGLFTGTIVTPVQKLAAASRSISQGQLEEADVTVDNKDELGELVESFNRMKQATKRNIQTLEENQRLADQLHREALERAETEKRLEAARMDLLQSQIKPHFLFNTLNTISGMAEIEEAEVTESMIRSLSRLFRYNLHTTDQFVSLSQELEVNRDYLYLQQMRFGDRVLYEFIPELGSREAEELSDIQVPVFLLQPLVENAVIHGISRKEQGGKITISSGKTDDALHIRVADTGVGMDPETLQGLKNKLAGAPSDVHVGIGIGNLYQRLNTLYGEDSLRISSESGEGTQIDVTIPLAQGGEHDAENIDR